MPQYPDWVEDRFGEEIDLFKLPWITGFTSLTLDCLGAFL